MSDLKRMSSAELRRLAAQTGSGFISDALHYAAEVNTLSISQAKRISELEAEVATLRLDAGRLDWLEDCAKCYWVTIQTQPGGSYCRSGQGVGVREAIDAAIKEQQ